MTHEFHLSAGRFQIQLTGMTRIMGVLNVTPDSFSDGGRYFNRDEAAAQAFKMEEEGADLIDIGGESSRPGATPVSEEEEIARVMPVLEKIVPRLKIPVSIDTCKASVAARAIEAGASMVNDIRALGEPGMAALIAEKKVPVVLMHMKGTPRTMQSEPVYESVTADILSFFERRIEQALLAGISRDQIVIDPGIGFGKTVSHNLELLRNLDQFHSLNCPVLIGTSNKSFIGVVLDRPVGTRLAGTLATVAWSFLKGIQFVRVHDVGPARDLIRLMAAIRDQGSASVDGGEQGRGLKG